MRSTNILTILGAIGVCALAFPLFAAGSSGAMQISEYADGSPRERVAWVAGEREGPCVRWSRDGVVRARGQYANGKLDGEWEFFLPSGDLDVSKSGLYSNGRLRK